MKPEEVYDISNFISKTLAEQRTDKMVIISTQPPGRGMSMATGNTLWGAAARIADRKPEKEWHCYFEKRKLTVYDERSMEHLLVRRKK